MQLKKENDMRKVMEYEMTEEEYQEIRKMILLEHSPEVATVQWLGKNRAVALEMQAQGLLSWEPMPYGGPAHHSITELGEVERAKILDQG
jgi:hypothetical protein